MNPVLKYEQGYKYQTCVDYRIQTRMLVREVETYWYKLTAAGILWIRRGYAWDGASGPTWDSKSSIIGSLVHDVLYQMLRAGELPHDPCFRIANEELKRLCANDGMWSWRAQLWFNGVQSFGSAFAAVQPDKILTAPL